MKKKTITDLLNKTDTKTIERLTEGKKVMTGAERERIFAMSRKKVDVMRNNAVNGNAGDYVNGVEKYSRPVIMKFAGMAAAAVILVGGIGGAAYLISNMNHIAPDNINIPQTGTVMTTGSTSSANTTVQGTADAKTTAAADDKTTAVTTVENGSAQQNEAVSSNNAVEYAPTEPVQSDTAWDAAVQQTEAVQQDKPEATAAEPSDSASDAITESQALDAIKNYCFMNNSELKNMVDSGEYNIYWTVTTNNAGEIVVLYRSYTGALIRYYIDPVSGETYVTEMVPGIINDEQRTSESLNVKNYLA